MTPSKIYLVQREVRGQRETIAPVCFFDKEGHAQEFCAEQEAIHTGFEYYVDRVGNGNLIPRDLEIAS